MAKPEQHRCWISSLALAGAGLALALVLVGVAAESAQAQTYSVLYSFGGRHGKWPLAGLVRDGKGNLYGTTVNGGAYLYGTVFKLDSTGKEKVLYSFCPGGYPCSDGCYPDTGLRRDKAGNLYGTVWNCGAFGYGAVFKLDMTGKLTLLHSFTGGADGKAPYAGVVQDEAGNLYGTTAGGGAYSWGTVFKLDEAGTYTVLHSFAEGQDGASPSGDLLRDSEGNLYGTTFAGGDGNSGIVFKVDATGRETVLYRFKGWPDGWSPNGALVRDNKGNLYGTTTVGGDHDNGTIFKLDTRGAETVLYSFTGGADGSQPYAGLVRDKAGNLYGTTAYRGNTGCHHRYGCGVVFELDTTGAYTVLHTFAGGADGGNSFANLILDRAGNLYGTAAVGGTRHGGTVFKLAP
jgi:uncharacterized repeat protein (TIGR03803 family)